MDQQDSSNVFLRYVDDDSTNNIEMNYDETSGNTIVRIKKIVIPNPEEWNIDPSLRLTAPSSLASNKQREA